MKTNKEKVLKPIEAEGVMTYSQLENGLHIFDFQCLEAVEMEEYCAQFKVKRMRDGNVYMEELPKRIRNRKPLNRQTNSTLSLGRDGYYYVRFRLPEGEVTSLPRLLLNEASAIAQWVLREVLNKV